MREMRTLVVFYSRSGNTRVVAELVAKLLGCDIDEIKPRTRRDGVWGYLRCLGEAILKFPAPIFETRTNPADYDLVVIGTPVWAGSVSSPVRTYLNKHRDQIRKAALFCTLGGRGGGRTFLEMERVLRRSAIDHCAVLEYEIWAGSHVRSVEEFAKSLDGGRQSKA